MCLASFCREICRDEAGLDKVLSKMRKEDCFFLSEKVSDSVYNASRVRKALDVLSVTR